MVKSDVHRVVTGGLLLVTLGCGAGSVAFREGRKAEIRKDYDSALVNYEKAVQEEPDNAQFLLHERQARTEAAIFHVKQGRRLLAENRPTDAVGQFQKATSIDPTNEAAAQELGRLLTQQAAAKRAREAELKQALKGREEATAPTGIQLKPFPPEPLPRITISADSRRVYETLAKLAGLNVAFTADFQARPVQLDLTNVTIEQALSILAPQTRTFWKPITSNTILVIPDTPNNRRDYEDEVVKTIFLSNPFTAADRTAITTALKLLLQIQTIVDNPDSNAIIVRGTPAKVAAAEQMVRDLDRGRAEILIEVNVLEADANRVRDLGLNTTQALVFPSPTFPSGTQAGLGSVPTATSTTGTSSTSATLTPSLPLIRFGHLSTGDFTLVVPGAVAAALLSDSRTRILENPQVRVTDGGTAKLRIGSRFPYATGSFLPSFGGSITGTAAAPGLGLLASTQFTYQDVGVNLDLSPHLLPNGEVALHAMIEIVSVGNTVVIGGVQEPTFGQRRIEHDIRLKEGEVSLLGGLIESSEARTVTGLPGLGQIPVLRYLFSTEHRERIETEVLVMLTPRVIRLPESASGAGGVSLSGATKTPQAASEFQAPPQPTAPPQ